MFKTLLSFFHKKNKTKQRLKSTVALTLSPDSKTSHCLDHCHYWYVFYTDFNSKVVEAGLSPEKPGDVLLAIFGHLLSPLPLLLLYLILLFISLGHLPLLQEPDGRELPPLKPKSWFFPDCLKRKAREKAPNLWSGRKRVSVGGRTASSSGVSSFNSLA